MDPGHSDRLRALLSLKRRELPPPGFFENLPRQVRARLGEAPRYQPTLGAWWRRLLLEWDVKPALAGIAIVAAGGMFFFSLDPEPVPPPAPFHWAGHLADESPSPDQAASSWHGRPSILVRTDATPSLSARLSTAPPTGMFSPRFGLETEPRADFQSSRDPFRIQRHPSEVVPANWPASP